MKTYTEEQKFTNYKFLVRSVHELRAGRKVTDDDIQYFKHIRYYCKDFEYCNMDVTDSRFRTKAIGAEKLCQYLDSYLSQHRTIEASAYIKLLEHIDGLFTHVMSSEELSTLVGMLKI